MQFKPCITAILFFAILSAGAQDYTLDSLLGELHLTSRPSEKIEILNQLAAGYYPDDPKQSEKYAEEALFLSESINDKPGIAKARYHIARIQLLNEKFDQAIELLKLSKLGFEDSHETEWLAKTELLLGTEYKRRLEYWKSLSLYYDALDVFTSRGSDQYIAITNNLIGGDFFDQGEYEKALDYFQTSLAIYTKMDNKAGMGTLYNNIGEIYRFTGDPLSALEYYRKSMLINLGLGRENQLAINYNNIGNILLTEKQPDSAQYYMNLSLSISERLNDPNLISSAYISLGKLYFDASHIEKALENFKQGYKSAQLRANMINIRNAAEGLGKVYAAKNNFEKAYNYNLEFKKLSDSIDNTKNLEKVTQLEMQYIFDHEQKLDEIRRQKVRFRYFSVAAVLFCILIVMTLIYGRQRIKIRHARSAAENLELEKLQLKEELDYKNRELATKVMYRVRKNELLNFINDKLVKALSKFSPKNKGKISEIIQGLQSNLDSNVWRDFEERFREVHRDFYQNLEINFPGLTDNDKKLCALLRLNFTTKEISAITHQSLNTIEVARTRLRKKLNIVNRDINLSNFLAGI